MKDEDRYEEAKEVLADRAPKFDSRWRHKATGIVYTVMCPCLIESTLEPAVAYYRSDAEFEVWVRPLENFLDGRFEFVSDGPIRSKK